MAAAFAPTGKLRASINLGNSILANAGPYTAAPRGVSVDLATLLAQRLQLEFELVVFDAARKSVEAVASEQADIGFFAIDPKRAVEIAFTAPYLLIEGCYLVRQQSSIRHNDDVDREGHQVIVGKGSAYDLFLTRELRRATIIRAPTSPAVVDHFLAHGAEVAAGVRQQLQADADRLGGLRLVDERFMVIQQAMGTPRSRGVEAALYLNAYVEEMKSSGFVAKSLERHSVNGASVAPAVLR